MTNHHHARDDWADARTDEALRRELDALAGLGAASSSLGDGLDGALGSVRTRIRRRRAAKQAGIGATALSVAAALAVGGAALLPEGPQPLPGPAGTPSPSQAPSHEPTAQGTAVGLIEDGYQPSWLEGSDLVCGMAAADLPATGGSARLELLEDPVLEDDTSADGTETVQYWRAPTRLAVDDPADAGLRVAPPTLVWVQDGRVVDVGIFTAEVGMDQVGDRPPEADAEDSSLTTCAPVHPTGDDEPTDTYETELPAGTYEVRAFVQLWSPDGQEVEIVPSDPVTLTIPGPDGA